MRIILCVMLFHHVLFGVYVCCYTSAVFGFLLGEVGHKLFVRCQLGGWLGGMFGDGDTKGFHPDCQLFVFGMLSAFDGFSISFYLK